MLMKLLILLFIQNLVSSETEYVKYSEQCDVLLRIPEEREFNDIIPGAEEILYRCPYFKVFMDCRIKHYIEEFESKNSLEDFRGLKSFVDDMCDENSHIHKAYAENLDCYRSMLVYDADGDRAVSRCHRIALNLFSEYRDSSYAFQIAGFEELDEEEQEEVKNHHDYYQGACLMKAYTSACVGTEILDTCGSEAFDTYIEVIKRARITNDFCGKESKNLYIKGFVDFLSNGKNLAEADIIRSMYNINVD